MMTASGDPNSQLVISKCLQSDGDPFASTLGGEVKLPDDVERIYEIFEATT